MKLNIIKSKKKGPTIVVVGCLHGNEIVGKMVIDALDKITILKGTLKTITANEEAMFLNKRFIQQDLNRSFPGNKKSKIVEEKLAFRILKEIQPTDYVIDIHSTTSDTEDVIIIKKDNSVTGKMIDIIRPKRVLFISKDYGNGALVNFCNGISIEYGKHRSKNTFNKSLNDIKKLMFTLGMINEAVVNTQIETQFYEVFGIEPKPKGFKLDGMVKNFEYISKGTVIGCANKKQVIAKEGFYPVLFGEKSYKDIIGFKARKVS